MKDNFDFVIIGAGIIGLNIALELRDRYPDSSIALMDKESTLAAHGSGRNSGVLHAGFYYTRDSFKARFCRDGNAALTEFCEERGLPIKKCGKLVAARNESELSGLDVLLQRGRENGIELEMVDEARAREIEPRIKTLDRALWSPTTASIDPGSVMSALANKAAEKDINLWLGNPYIKRKNDSILTAYGEVGFGYLVNAAGLYADHIARDFGFARDLRMLPFKGLYLYRTAQPEELRTHVYPVPDLDYPFLGVHFTLAVDGRAKIGPTAIPAFWRENYGGMRNFSLPEFLRTAGDEAMLMLRSDFDFKKLALTETRKRFRRNLVRRAATLLEGVDEADFTEWGRPGIRAQLYDVRKRKLVMDFCTREDEKSFHVLNAVSPALTASMPFAAYCCDRMGKLIS
ncbi:MAG: L-2-hydroxyglutarate oxidase [Desulfovibrionales bacterium]